MEQVKQKVPNLNVISPVFAELPVEQRFKISIGLRRFQANELIVIEPDIQIMPGISLVSIFSQPQNMLNLRLKYIDITLLGDFLVELESLIKVIARLPVPTQPAAVSGQIQMLLVEDMRACQGKSDEEVRAFLKKKMPQLFAYEETIQEVSYSVQRLCVLANDHLERFIQVLQERVESKVKLNAGKKTIDKKEVDQALQRASKEADSEVAQMVQLAIAAKDEQSLIQLAKKHEEQHFYDELRRVQW